MPEPCHCPICPCSNQAQEPPHAADLCLVCENARLWRKTDPAYGGCLCVCKCRLARAPGSLQCQDCLDENGRNRRRHRLHGKPKPKREEEEERAQTETLSTAS